MDLDRRALGVRLKDCVVGVLMVMSDVACFSGLEWGVGLCGVGICLGIEGGERWEGLGWICGWYCWRGMDRSLCQRGGCVYKRLVLGETELTEGSKK